jgi:hypothetical protein
MPAKFPFAFAHALLCDHRACGGLVQVETPVQEGGGVEATVAGGRRASIVGCSGCPVRSKPPVARHGGHVLRPGLIGKRDPLATAKMGALRASRPAKALKGGAGGRPMTQFARASPFLRHDRGLGAGLPRFGDRLTPATGPLRRTIHQVTDGVP